MHLNDAFGHSALTPVYCLHESGAAFAACGEAAYTGKLAVCLVTSGPGSTNALTGCASAFMDSLPVLFISGDAKREQLDLRDTFALREAGQQDVDILHMVNSITKLCAILRTPFLLERDLSILITEAMTPRRGPVWLDIPLDVQAEDVE
jgi:acetolactate synthase I/II/III large subunit